jgi:hypothetical protein
MEQCHSALPAHNLNEIAVAQHCDHWREPRFASDTDGAFYKRLAVDLQRLFGPSEASRFACRENNRRDAHSTHGVCR